MRESGDVQVNITDIGASDHFLVWLELGRVTKCCKRQKRILPPYPCAHGCYIIAVGQHTCYRTLFNAMNRLHKNNNIAVLPIIHAMSTHWNWMWLSATMLHCVFYAGLNLPSPKKCLSQSTLYLAESDPKPNVPENVSTWDHRLNEDGRMWTTMTSTVSSRPLLSTSNTMTRR